MINYLLNTLYKIMGWCQLHGGPLNVKHSLKEHFVPAVYKYTPININVCEECAHKCCDYALQKNPEALSFEELIRYGDLIKIKK